MLALKVLSISFRIIASCLVVALSLAGSDLFKKKKRKKEKKDKEQNIITFNWK